MKKILGLICTMVLLSIPVAALAADYVITFDPNGGVVDESTITLSNGETFSHENTPTKSNYDFVGWAYSNDSEYTIKLQEMDVSSSMTLYAKYTEDKNNTFTITLDANGGWYRYSPKVYVTTVNNGTPDIPGNPSREGYKFKGWSTSASSSDTTDPSYATTDSTYYAVWEDINNSTGDEKVTVTFDSAGGNTIPTQTIIKGSTVEKPANPTATNMDFVAWYLGDKEFDFTQPVNEDIILTAHWNSRSMDSYTVTFVAGYDNYGGKYSDGTQAKSYQANSYTELNPETPLPTRHTSFGWWSQIKPVTLNDNNALVWDRNQMITGNTTLYAVYVSADNQGTVAEVTFKYNGGKLDGKEKYVVEIMTGTAVEEPEKPKRKGYKFKGWYTSSNSFTEDNEYDFADAVTGDLTLYAGWTETDDEDDDDGVRENDTNVIPASAATQQVLPNPENQPVVEPVATYDGAMGATDTVPTTGVGYDSLALAILGCLILIAIAIYTIKKVRS